MTPLLSQPIRRMMPFRFTCAILLGIALSGCSSVPRAFNAYKIDVQQGNVITQEMASQLRPGLSKDQVRFALGTPLLIDMFHADRWDYVYRLQKGNTGEVELRKMSVFFDAGGKLTRVEGDVVGASAADATVAPEARARVIDLGSLPADGKPMPPAGERGFFGKMMGIIGF